MAVRFVPLSLKFFSLDMHTREHVHACCTQQELPISGTSERAKAGSPESSDCDSTDGSAKDPSLIPKYTDLGKRVLFFSSHDKKQKYGVLRYLGEPEFADGVWCGIELDKPDGKNKGSIHGIRYFTCDQNHGVFVPLSIVELDPSRRSRSRPNSAPSSRTPSADRGTKKAKTMAAPATSGGGKQHFILQQELVNRLSTPALQKRKPAQSPASGRGPMKAFATKGLLDQPLGQHNRKKSAFTPFKSGAIQKAVSTDNLKSLNEKEKRSQAGGLTSKKSSSQKDLRSANTSPSTASVTSAPQGKGRRKPQRAGSCSNLFDENSSPGHGGGGGAKTKTKANVDAKLKRHSDLLSMSDTQVYNWPRTSTPGDRNDQTPDGCSSPEGAEMSDTHSTTSSTTETVSSSCCEKMETDTPGLHERGFITTPNSSSSSTENSSVNGSTPLDSSPTGLVTQTNQFVRNERKCPSVDACRIASPDGSSAHQKHVYKNRPSGTATLPHPLTLQTAGSLVNGTDSSYYLSPTSFTEHFLGPNASVSCSLSQLTWRCSVSSIWPHNS